MKTVTSHVKITSDQPSRVLARHLGSRLTSHRKQYIVHDVGNSRHVRHDGWQMRARAGTGGGASGPGSSPPHAAPSRNTEGISMRGTRRDTMLLMGTMCVSLMSDSGVSYGVQGLTAGRIPGVTGPNAEGFYTYTRPEGKSGGHGVGWSEIPRYTFIVPEGWEEKPVSIADLGGTEIDLRFEHPDQGNLLVVVAPVLRFMDVGYNARIDIQQIGPPDKIIAGFAPELYGKPLMDDDVLDTSVVEDGGLTYYQWQVKPHHLVSATAVGNRVFILSTTSNSRQWRKAKDDLLRVQKSFRVLS